MNKYSIRSIFISLFLIISCFFNIGNSSFVINEESKKDGISIKDGSKAVCHIGGTKYTSIGKAIESAISGDIIYVYPGNKDKNNKNYEIKPTSTNTLTIKSGVTLCIPYSQDQSSTYKASIYNNPKGLGSKPTTPLSIVTLKEGTTLINNGTIEIGGEISAGSGNNPSSYTTTKYSSLLLGNNSIIENVGKIDVYGYLGETEKNNGSKIICHNTYKYLSELNEEITITGNSELNFPFYWYDFNGGSALKAIYDSINEKKCMPLDDFYFENITVESIIYGKSKVSGWVNLYAAKNYGSYVIELISTNNTAIITYNSDSSYVVCNYDELTYQMSMDFYGPAIFNELNIDVKKAITDSAGILARAIAKAAGVPRSVSSSLGYFPLTYHFNISLNKLPNEDAAIFDGSKNQYKLMNGGSFVINEGVSFVTNSFIVYDGWDYYTGRSTHANSNKTILNLRSDIVNTEAYALINGILTCDNCASGKFFTNKEGSIITSSKSITAVMYEPKRGEGDKTRAKMKDWFSKEFKLILNNETNVMAEVSNTGTYKSFANESFYYWKLSEDKK